MKIEFVVHGNNGRHVETLENVQRDDEVALYCWAKHAYTDNGYWTYAAEDFVMRVRNLLDRKDL